MPSPSELHHTGPARPKFRFTHSSGNAPQPSTPRSSRDHQAGPQYPHCGEVNINGKIPHDTVLPFSRFQ